MVRAKLIQLVLMATALGRIIQLPSRPILAIESNGIIHARGVPYATADRFKKPQLIPAGSSDDVLDCTQPATICPQSPSRLGNIVGNMTDGRTQSENCLHVSVTAPVNANGAPVMVFFHGGAYVGGGGDLDEYSGHEISEQQGVVVVSVTSRLSVWGYLKIPGYAPANLGLMDQIAALKWVNENIAAFGGNPEKVTVWGQSAGGDSVFCLLLAESTQGLFNRAIIESAPFGWYADNNKTAMLEAMGAYAQTYLDENQNPSVEDLLKLKDDVAKVGKSLDTSSILTYGTELGQEPLPNADEVDRVLVERAQETSIMIGWNKNEGTAFVGIDPDPTHDADWITQNGFVIGAKKYLKLIRDTMRKMPAYEFVWSPANSTFGTVHCIELPFLLGDWEAWKDAPMLGGEKSRSIVERLGRQMKKLWAAFASGSDLDGIDFVIDQGFEAKWLQ